MKKIINAKEIAVKELHKTMTDILLNYSDVGEKGRFISSATFSHILHEVLPAEIQRTLKDYDICKKEGTDKKPATLKAYIQQKQNEYIDHVVECKMRNNGYYSGIPFEEEELIWAIQDWYSMKGEFTEEELYYLEAIWDLDQCDIESIVDIKFI